MAKRKKTRKFRRKKKQPPQRKVQTVEYLLEKGSLQDMRAAKSMTEALLKYNWDYYSELVRQRNIIQNEISQVLIQFSTSNFKFQNWQRAVKWKYGLHPLSTKGSLTYIGQRFNIGTEVNPSVPYFSALYLAVDKDTALQETLGQEKFEHSPLTPIELALANPQSEAIVSVSGELEKVFDLRSDVNLKGFVELVKGFKVSETLKKAAKFLGLDQPDVVTKSSQLLDTLLDTKWRDRPSNFDVPANSQVFGHLIYQAGIEGIVYPSKLTGKDCLAVFPANFVQTSSYVQLDDEPPLESVLQKVDSSNWRQCELSYEELKVE